MLMMHGYVGKTVKFKVPPEVYAMLEAKIRAHHRCGVSYVTETFYGIFMMGLEVLGTDGVEKLILDNIRTKKERAGRKKGLGEPDVNPEQN
jgi:hypothetical protein